MRILGSLVALGFMVGASPPVWSADAGAPATIMEQKDEWQNVYGLLYYRVTGNVKNTAQQPIDYVKLTLELLDTDGKVVASQVGYNQKAQFLAEEEGAGGEELLDVPGVEKPVLEPLAPGESDFFRVGVTKKDLPAKVKLGSYCIKITEAPLTGKKEAEGGKAEQAAKTPAATFESQCVQFEQPTAKPGENKLNLNTATQEDLMKLPDMTVARAKAILLHRKGHGDFIQIRELQMIPQVTPIYDKIKGELVLE